MSVFEKGNIARENMDFDAWVNLLPEDYTFVRHQLKLSQLQTQGERH